MFIIIKKITKIKKLIKYFFTRNKNKIYQNLNVKITIIIINFLSLTHYIDKKCKLIGKSYPTSEKEFYALTKYFNITPPIWFDI